MRTSRTLTHAGRLISLGRPMLWATVVWLMVPNVAAVASTSAVHIRVESGRAGQDKSECEQLKKKVADLEKYRQVDYLRDLLTKEEQRAEALQAQLLDMSEKEAPFRARLDQLDEQLRPENIDQSLAGVGSMRPEDAKEALRRRLTNEKRRQQTQLDLLHQNSTRLQAALASADASIQRLRLRLTEVAHP